MTVQEFTASLSASAPAPDWPQPLAALWHDARGNWEEAHRIVQELDDEDAAWVHAYLHRKEGDSGNARHWYRRACRTFSEDTLPDEWSQIVTALISGDRGFATPLEST